MKEIRSTRLTRWVSGILFCGGLVFYVPAVIKYIIWADGLNLGRSYLDLVATTALTVIGTALWIIAVIWVMVLGIVIRDWLEDH